MNLEKILTQICVGLGDEFTTAYARFDEVFR